MKKKIARLGVEYASKILALSKIEAHFKSQSFFRYKNIHKIVTSQNLQRT